MSRRRVKNKPSYFYCPKCEQKKLRSDYITDLSIVGRFGQCRRIWSCDNDRVPVAGGGVGYCDCKISVEGRDAEISDYENVLDRMVSSTPPIITWILGNYPKVHKTGLKALYVGEHLDLVRLRDDDGIGIYVFFRMHTVEVDEELARLMRSAAGQHIKFRGVSMNKIFSNARTMLYSKTSRSWGGPIFPDKNETPDLHKVLISWAKEMDKEFKLYVEMMTKESAAFGDEEKKLIAEINALAGGIIDVQSYDYVTDRAYIRTNATVTRAQLQAMANALKALGPAGVALTEPEESG
jgi:hypothetical protein